ncbi:unnamed protein product, partial [Rotaria sordida]
WYSSNYAKAIGMPETPDGSPLGLFIIVYIIKKISNLIFLLALYSKIGRMIFR